jgi:8-oxo-dGTP pyrophosphatase MutT (NUDIX family)
MPHIHEKIDFIAEAYIIHDGRVLLRKHDKYKQWFPVGGHIELDEDPPHAAIREAKEEVGLDIEIVAAIPVKDPNDSMGFKDARELIPPRFMNRHQINDTHEHIALIYFATSKSDVIRQGHTEISEDIRWLTDKELDDPTLGISDRVKYYAHAALEALSLNSSSASSARRSQERKPAQTCSKNYWSKTAIR